MKVSIICWMVVLFFPQCGFGNKTGILPEIYKPEQVAVDKDQIYIVQAHNIFVYSRRNLNLVKAFGRKGAGPKEFNGRIRVFPRNDHLVVTSSGKVSFYSKQGRYIREGRIGAAKEGQFLPHREGFVGHGYAASENQEIFRTINFYDEQLNNTGEIFRYRLGNGRPGKKGRFNLMHRDTWPVAVDGNRIVIGDPEGSIRVLNIKGKNEARFSGDYEIVPFTLYHRKDLIEKFLLAQPGKSGSFNQWKNKLDFPEFFPLIQTLETSDGKVLILTHKRAKGKGKIFLFKIDGTFIKKSMIPIFDYSPKDTYPLTFFKGQIYQVVENPDTEVWELHKNSVY